MLSKLTFLAGAKLALPCCESSAPVEVEQPAKAAKNKNGVTLKKADIIYCLHYYRKKHPLEKGCRNIVQ